MPGAPRPKSKPLHDQLLQAARNMRYEPTPAEKALWDRLRDRQVSGCKFRRQQAIDRFVVDFYCAERKLILEVDGPIHQTQQAQDVERQGYLETLGLRVIRFTNDEILNDMNGVIERLSKALKE
jgi:very-short-patch-repair endonuclease